MTYLLYIAVMLACLLSTPAYSDELGTIERPIVNGSVEPRAIALSASEQLAVGWMSKFRQPGDTFCTGTLITSRVVITAKHCTDEYRYDEMFFGLGREPTQSRVVFDLSRKIEHPTEDVALLILNQDAVDTLNELNRGNPGSENSVTPIAVNRHTLTGPDRDELIGRIVEVTGYGETNDVTRSGRYFAQVELTDINNKFVVVDGKGDSGLCFGDSGGPVLAVNLRGKPVILGVESKGDPNCSGVDYLARLDSLRDWVDDGIRSTWMSLPVGSPCRDLTFLGRCVGNTVEWCDENQVINRLDCSVRQSVCLYVNHTDGYYCARPPHCDRGSLHCDSKYDGFLPSGPATVSMVSDGCQSAPAQDDLSPIWWATLLLVGLGRACVSSRPA